MASLSLPRVLQLKKNSLDAEREQFEKFQTLAIQKAINSIETPVKEKHVRSTIIGTFQEQSAITYWMVAIRLPLQDNRIVAWKFCHVTHKLLREGHPACLDDSQRHIGMIENLGKLWVHLREGYGKLVHLYSNLLVCKLKFHSRNPRFPGNMQLTANELDAIAENDVNNYFQLCVELFDYMDDILNLQAAVFDSLGNARANSMTASGQCRLAALIPCAQDSSHIYDCNVRLLFRLHASLPPDTLSGHRERFRQQFKKLSSFYKHASSLQYYRNLLTLPLLPANPPNFLLQSDFGTYVAPVVSIPEPPPDEVDAVGSLIDTSDLLSQSTTPDQIETFDNRSTSSPQPDPLLERDRLIDHLQNEVRRLRSEVSQLEQERHSMVDSMREHCARLETQLHTAKVELNEEKQKAEVLSAQAPEIKKKLTETEDKAKVTDEKFQKLKGAYTQLREEHIALIRQKAEVDKATAALRASAAQHESAKMALQQQLNDRLKDVELLQQSASSSEEIDAYKNEIASLRNDLELSRQKELELETLRASMEAMDIEHKTAMTEQHDKITTIGNELKDTIETLEATKKEKVELEFALSGVKHELEEVKEKSGDEYKKVLEEKQAALSQVEELTKQFQQEKQEQNLIINNLKSEVENMQQQIKEDGNNFQTKLLELNELLVMRSKTFNESLTAKDEKLSAAQENIEMIQKQFEETQNRNKEDIAEKLSQIDSLKEEIRILTKQNDENVTKINCLEKERSSLDQNLKTIIKQRDNFAENLTLKENEVQQLEEKIKDLSHKVSISLESENNKIVEISALKEVFEKNIAEKNDQIKKIEEEREQEITSLKDQLKTMSDDMDGIIANLKDVIKEKDSQVISLDVEVNKLSAQVSMLEDELKETNAELEIGKNELISLREEHEAIIERRDFNLALKNDELRLLNEKVNQLTDENNNMRLEKNNLIDTLTSDKQVLKNDLQKSQEDYENLKNVNEEILMKKEQIISKLSLEKEELQKQSEQLEESMNENIQSLNNQIDLQNSLHATLISEKDKMIADVKSDLFELHNQLEAVKENSLKEKEELTDVVCKKEKEIQILEVRLSHIEKERLNAECELQDLLQHNTVLEADVITLRKQLEDAQKEIEKQRSKVLECAGEAALEVTKEAIAALEQASERDTSRAAAQLAAAAIADIAAHTHTKGNEEKVGRAAIFVAHNTVQLSAYIAEMCNGSTNAELTEKLNSECRAMLSETAGCLEALRSGGIQQSVCGSVLAGVQRAARAAADAERVVAGGRTVDDELADMDHAVALAASQIEEMLAASRAGDTGVKLEVNEKILDACTTLMAAVKLLVQDARQLQTELGDPSTRRKMYRKNPQWSEGLISAAKAVVFAAKLLVSSADEAVGSEGRVEGVSVGAHEVAGSTAQLVAASRARAPHGSSALARLTGASRQVATATGAVVAAVRAAAALRADHDALDTAALATTLTAARRLEHESKVRSLELEAALDTERTRLAALRKRHYQLAQEQENGNVANGGD